MFSNVVYWRRKEKISWTDCLKNMEVSRRVMEESIILPKIK